MSLYRTFILPHLIHCACQMKPVMEQRQHLVPRAQGAVLEIGIGSGLNLPFYDPDRVKKLVGLDPSEALIRKAKNAAKNIRFEIEFTPSSAERIPFVTAGFDTVLSTYTLCTIPDIEAALREIHRVLRPDGIFLFLEHGASPEERIRCWQDRLTPIWKRIAGGCHLNRVIPQLIKEAGFTIPELDTYYLRPGWKPATFHYRGIARS